MAEWYVLAFITAILSSIAILINKKILIKEHAMEFSTVFAILNVILSFFLIKQVDFSSVSLNLLILIFFIGIFATVAFLYMVKAIRHMEISSAMPLTNISPALVAILSFFILREAITSRQMWALGLIIIGTYVLEVDHKFSDLKQPFIKIIKSKYIHYIFLGMFLYAFTAIGDRYILTHGINSFTYLFIVQIFIMINFIILIHIFHDGLQGIKNGFSKNWKWILLLSVLTVSNRIVFFEAAAIAFVPLVIAVQRISTLFSTILGGELFHEKGLTLKIIACTITLIGAILIVI